MTSEQVKKIIIDAFEKEGLKILIGGCGCCGSPFVTIRKDDETVLEEDCFKVNTIDPDE